MEYSQNDLRAMYYNLVRGRIFNEKMHKAVNAGKLRTSYHSTYGQEATGVAVVSAMRNTDWLVPNHRFQTAAIMRLDMYKFIAELFAKADGIQKGSAYDFHCNDYGEGRYCYFDGLLGTTVPTYTGFAWSLKQQKKDEIVVIVLGDGACSEGNVYEGWNLAALKKVPAVYVIENNQWAMTVPLKHESANPNISEKAVPIGLSAQIVDGYDILAVRNAMDIAIEKARNFEPNVVEVKTRRWEAHFVGQGNDYRDDLDIVERDKQINDPIMRYEKYLFEYNVIDAAYADELKKEISDELDILIEKAVNAPIAKLEEIYNKNNVFANPLTGGDL